MAGSLASLGCEVDVLAWTRSLAPGALETLDAASVDRSAAGATLHRLGLFANLDFSMQHTLNVLEWLHGRRAFDAVWGHFLFPAGFLAVLFGSTHELPSTVSARGNDVDRLTFPPGDFARLCWTLERARVISAVSRDLARKITVLAGREIGVAVVGNAVDPEIFKPGPRDQQLADALGIESGDAVLAFCGELREKKGLPFLLQALATANASRPTRLLVIGEARPREEARLASFAAERPDLASRLIVTGRLQEQSAVASHLRLADVFLMPSLWDGLPNALLEAMATELPVLASDAGGIPEAVEHARTGYLIGRPDLHRLGEAALEILALPEAERAAIGRAARRAVIERFHPAIEARALAAVLSRLGIPSTAT